jgi:hypothetical protein
MSVEQLARALQPELERVGWNLPLGSIAAVLEALEYQRRAGSPDLIDLLKLSSPHDPDEVIKHLNAAAREIERLRPLAQELLASCKELHQALDIMFAMMIQRTLQDENPFYPTTSGRPWAACCAGHRLIQRAERELGERK